MSLILDTLFPKKCVGCNRTGSYFCQDCIRNIRPADLYCPQCDRPAFEGKTHPICRRKYGLDGLFAMGIYKDPLKKAIQKLKYKGIKELAEILVDKMVENLEGRSWKGWAIVPVPLYWMRENSRGFNQSGLIGKLLAEKLGLEYKEILKRTHYTHSQARLKSEQRKQNIKNAFAINSRLSTLATNIILVDDVWTTGSTIRECCYILKKAGAKSVWALTLAR